jgi:hypothetical protein
LLLLYSDVTGFKGFPLFKNFKAPVFMPNQTFISKLDSKDNSIGFSLESSK